MSDPSPTSPASGAPGAWPDTLLVGGEMGQRIHEFDWSQTPLGPIADWPPSLRTMVGIVAAAPYPMMVM